MRTLVFCSLLAASAALLPASIVATPEAAGVQSTTTTGVITQDFNSFSAGAFAGVTNIGTYATGGAIVLADAFGGSNGTRYISVGAQSGTTSYNLVFTGLQSYFGFYWAAIDPLNSVQFYNGGSLVGTFTSATIEAGLSNPNSYLGNPNNGQDGNEHFVYVNFNADGSSLFNKVVFNNTNGTTGFETDNHSIKSAVPEPNAYMLTGLGLAALILLRSRKLIQAA